MIGCLLKKALEKLFSEVHLHNFQMLSKRLHNYNILCVYCLSFTENVNFKINFHTKNQDVLQILNVGRYNLDIQSSEGMQKIELVQNTDSKILFLITK